MGTDTNSRGWREKKSRELHGLERRIAPVVAMELRDIDADTYTLTGFPSVTAVAYDVGWYQETIMPGAFKRTLRESPDVQLLINHTGMPLARTTSGTLRLEERLEPDSSGRRGLWVTAELDKQDPDVQSLARKMKRGDIDQMSFAFQVTTSDWNEDYTRRKITGLSLHRGDVSVVNQGANPASTATIRAAEATAAKPMRALPPARWYQEQLVRLYAGQCPQPHPWDTDEEPMPDHLTRAREILAEIRRTPR